MINNESNYIQTLEEKGMLTTTKNYLHNKLIETLKNKSIKSQNISNLISENKNNQISSLIRLSFSIILDFFSKMNLPYSYSTFNNESKILLSNTSIPFTESEIINHLNINMSEFERSKKNILSGIQDSTLFNNGNNLGSTFLFYLMKNNTNFLKNETESQTNISLITNPIKYNNDENNSNNNILDYFSIDEKLKLIEEKNYKKLTLDKIFPVSLRENRFIKYKDNIDKRYEEELKNGINRFQSIEIGKMRIEENKKYSERIEKIKEEYEKQLKEKNDLLTNKINEFEKFEKEIKEEYENKIKEDNIIIQNKINSLEEKENEIDLKYKNELKEIENKKDELKLKEQEINYIKEMQEENIKSEIEKVKKNYEFQLNEERIKLEEENQKILSEKMENDKKENLENIELKNQLNNMKKELDEMKDIYSKANIENSKLKEQIKEVNNKNLNLLRASNRNNNINNKVNNEIKEFKQNLNDLKKEIINEKPNDKNLNKSQLQKTQINNSNIKNNINNNKINNNSSISISGKLYESMPNQNPKIIINDNNEKNKNKKENKKENKNLNMNIPRKRINNISKKIPGYNDRRKILEELEKEQNLLSSELRSEFKNLLNNDLPIVLLNKEAIEKMKETNNLNDIIYKNIQNERVKSLNDFSNEIRTIKNKEKNNDNKEENKVENIEKEIINENKEESKEESKEENKEENKIENNDDENINEEKEIKSKSSSITEIQSQSSSLNDIKKASSDNNNSNKKENISIEDKNNLKENEENKNSIIETILNHNSIKKNNESIEQIIKNKIPIINNSINKSNKSINKNQNTFSPKNINNQSQNSKKKETTNLQNINKFQNIDYDNIYNDINNKEDNKNEEIEEINDEIDYDISGNYDKKQSTDNKDKKGIGSNNKVSISNISGIMKNSIKDSITETNFDKLLQFKKDDNKESLSYNEFDGSSNYKKKVLSSNNQIKTISGKEITEEIINNEESI